MGEIVANVELENSGDRALVERGYGQERQVRRSSVDAVVDTGAAMLVLPQNVVERLGLETQRTVVVTCADERKEERPLIVLEALDLIADCANRTLTPRFPDYPLLKLK